MLTPDPSRLGFHQLKNACDAESRVVTVTRTIIEWLSVIHENTLHAAPLWKAEPPGSDPYRFVRKTDTTEFGPQSLDEAKLERSLAKDWSDTGDVSKWFLAGVCRGFQSYQVPTAAEQAAQGWGDIDLLGVSASWMPQVWEIKRRNSNDSPFHLVLQAVAYGIAVRHAWNRGVLAKEWETVRPEVARDQLMNHVELFGVAPTAYWDKARSKWLGTPPLYAAFSALLQRSAEAGFPVTLVEFEAEPISQSPFYRTGPGHRVVL